MHFRRAVGLVVLKTATDRKRPVRPRPAAAPADLFSLCAVKAARELVPASVTRQRWRRRRRR